MEQPPKGQPTVTVHAEKVKAGAGHSAILKFKTRFTQSDEIFYILWKELQPGKYKPIYKSEGQPKQKGF